MKLFAARDREWIVHLRTSSTRWRLQPPTAEPQYRRERKLAHTIATSVSERTKYFLHPDPNPLAHTRGYAADAATEISRSLRGAYVLRLISRQFPRAAFCASINSTKSAPSCGVAKYGSSASGLDGEAPLFAARYASIAFF